MKIKQKPLYLLAYLVLAVLVSPLGFGASIQTAHAYKCPDPSTYYEAGECHTYKKIDGQQRGDGSIACPSGAHHQDADGTCWATGGPSNGDVPIRDDGTAIDPHDITCRTYDVPSILGPDKTTYYYADRNSCCTHLETGIPGLNDQIDPSACVAPELIPDPTDPANQNPNQTQDKCNDGSTPDPNTHKCADGSTPGEAAAPNGHIDEATGRCGEARVNIIVCGEKGGNEALTNVLKIALRVLTVLVGVAAVGGLAWAAVQYARATDDTGVVSEAKKLIRNVIIGIVLYGFLVAIVNWLIPGGVFG